MNYTALLASPSFPEKSGWLLPELREVSAEKPKAACYVGLLTDVSKALRFDEPIKLIYNTFMFTTYQTQVRTHLWQDILDVDKQDNFLAQYRITVLLNEEFHNGKFNLVNKALKSLDVDSASPDLLVSILSSTLPARQKLKHRSTFYQRVEDSLEKRGLVEPRLLEGLQ